jgi:hypothetical protein
MNRAFWFLWTYVALLVLGTIPGALRVDKIIGTEKAEEGS